MDQQIANYVRGKAVEILLVGGATFLAFLVLGLNYTVLLAVLVGLSVLIPTSAPPSSPCRWRRWPICSSAGAAISPW